MEMFMIREHSPIGGWKAEESAFFKAQHKTALYTFPNFHISQPYSFSVMSMPLTVLYYTLAFIPILKYIQLLIEEFLLTSVMLLKQRTGV